MPLAVLLTERADPSPPFPSNSLEGACQAQSDLRGTLASAEISADCDRVMRAIRTDTDESGLIRQVQRQK